MGKSKQSMNTLKTVIIDSGLMEGHPAFSNFNIIKKISVIECDGKIVFVHDDIKDCVGHGTAVASVFAKECLETAYIIIKVFNDMESVTNTNVIIETLKYIYVNVECDIIHMSSGTLYDDSALYNICRNLTDKGVIIVSAFDNNGGVSFPAAYDNVIGVDITPYCRKTSDFIVVDNSIVNILVKSSPMRLAWIYEPYYSMQQGTSYAAPLVTIQIMKFLLSGKKKENILEAFKAESIKTIIRNKRRPSQKAIPFTIERAVLFPYNKEMHALVKFHDMLSFNISAVCDVKHSLNIGKCIKELNQNVTDFTDINLKNVDTLVLGHISELNSVLNYDIMKCIVQKCLENQLNVYAFDKEFSEYLQKNNVNINNFYPYFEQDESLNSNFGKLYSIPVPVVGIYGTGSRQGKFTLQLLLRKYFMKMGYLVGQIGTEPTAPLFEMDGVIPFGFNSTVRMDNRNFVSTINSLLYKISKGKDLIFIGSQSGSVPFLYNNMRQITLEQMDFIVAAMADIAILCVNIDDDIEYIGRTIDFINGAAKTKVRCIAIFPLKFRSNWGFVSNVKEMANDLDIQNMKEKISTMFGLKSYVIDEANARFFVNEIIEALSED